MTINDLPDRIRKKIQFGPPEECWPWIGAKRVSGYGKLRMGGKEFYAHRVIYELLIGPIPKGLQIDHLCRNRACVSPYHLEIVTPKMNIQRGIPFRQRTTHCPQGHPYTPENTYLYHKDGRPRGAYRQCRACALERAQKWAENNRERRRAIVRKNDHKRRQSSVS
jgi:hypothetical protein